MLPMQKAVETHYSALKLAQSYAVPACFPEKKPQPAHWLQQDNVPRSEIHHLKQWEADIAL